MASRHSLKVPLFVALLVGAVPIAHAQQLTVKGVSEIAKFETLKVSDSGDLVSPQGLAPGKVKPAGAVEPVGNFKASALAGARLTYNGADVGKINAAGTHVVTLAGLPVLPGWLASLSKPKEGPGANANNITDAFKTGESAGLVGAARGDLEVFDVRLLINNVTVADGSTVEIPESGMQWRMCLRVRCPGAKHEIGHKLGFSGPGNRGETYTAQLKVGQEANHCGNVTTTFTPPKGKDLIPFRVRAFASMPGELKTKNNEVDVEVTLKVKR